MWTIGNGSPEKTPCMLYVVHIRWACWPIHSQIPCSTRYCCTLRARWGQALSSCRVKPSPTVSVKPLTMGWRMLFSYTAAVMFPSIGTSGVRQPNMTPAQNMIEPPNCWWRSTVIEGWFRSPVHLHTWIELLSGCRPILTSSENKVLVHWSHVL